MSETSRENLTFGLILLLDCTLRGTRGDFSTENRGSRLGPEETEADAVFYADPESVVRSVQIVMHQKAMTAKSSKIAKNILSRRRSPELIKKAGFHNLKID